MNSKALGSKKNEIKNALLQGGLVVADRGSGKTWAMCEILSEDPDAVLIVVNSNARDFVMRYLANGSRLAVDQVKNRVIVLNPENTRALHDLYFFTHNKNVYVDELDRTGYGGQFKGATATFHYPVKVVR